MIYSLMMDIHNHKYYVEILEDSDDAWGSTKKTNDILIMHVDTTYSYVKFNQYNTPLWKCLNNLGE